jgi:tetratricopeptide (TPR) repeat protein
MQAEISTKVLRRLAAAEGYLDLDMPDHALEELEGIEDAGVLEAPRQFLKGEALKAQQRYDEAIEPLRRAAQMIPAPHNKMVWLSLSECFRHRGQTELADLVETFARAPQQAIMKVMPILNITVTIQDAIDALSDEDSFDEDGPSEEDLAEDEIDEEV